MAEEDEAIPFITTTDEGEFRVEPKAVKYLESIRGRVAIVAVAGPWRTGKSFLLNQLMVGDEDYGSAKPAEPSGFVVGPTINACTKGIWLWGRPLQMPGGLQVVFMDTEGLGSTTRSQTEDVNIFSLALLLSSYFIWNSRGVIDGGALEDFALVVNITKHIHVRSQAVQGMSGSGGADPKGGKQGGGDGPLRSEMDVLGEYFPAFLWVVRDFTLRLEEDGRKISDRQYLEKALKPQAGFSSEAANRNQIRNLLTTFFRERDCVTLVRPAEEEQALRSLGNLSLDALRPEFRAGLKALKQKVFGMVRPKMLHGRILSGPMVATLATTYVESINRGGAPTISSAWERVLETQAAQAVDTAVQQYEEQMGQKLGIFFDQETGKPQRMDGEGGMPVEEEDLEKLHDQAEQEAAAAFLSNMWGQTVQAESTNRSVGSLHAQVSQRLGWVLALNRSVSATTCKDLGSSLCRDLLIQPAQAVVDSALPPPPPPTDECSESDAAAGAVAVAAAGWESAEAELSAVCDGLAALQERYTQEARGPMKWATFTDILTEQVVGCLVSWGQRVGDSQRRACRTLRQLISQLNQEREGGVGRLATVRQLAERAQQEGRRTLAETQTRYAHEVEVLMVKIEAARARVAQTHQFLDQNESAYALLNEVLREQVESGEQMKTNLRGLLTKLQDFTIQDAMEQGDSSDEENESEFGQVDENEDLDDVTVWDIKAQLSTSETELRMLRQEIDVKEQHLKANMGLLDIKEKELTEVEYNWGVSKAGMAQEVDDVGEVEEETQSLQRIVQAYKDYIMWTSRFGKIPADLSSQLTQQQLEIFSQR
eukprot:CAMPEP_0113935390 /NCGR_PEP_ID=MMETSP1339-20121228/2546_1 /TAXON_ID=94617 /ORGANISM="Fibrocapsa japonica" /LENGTH=822 /DNA_ID=CAMNT_0000937531 /DNA_START=19 /DNA_END=2487 /DNA_ORIENTATION=+ /assembly_acc=CAM_ASM_000762